MLHLASQKALRKDESKNISKGWIPLIIKALVDHYPDGETYGLFTVWLFCR